MLLKFVILCAWIAGAICSGVGAVWYILRGEIIGTICSAFTGGLSTAMLRLAWRDLFR